MYPRDIVIVLPFLLEGFSSVLLHTSPGERQATVSGTAACVGDGLAKGVTSLCCSKPEQCVESLYKVPSLRHHCFTPECLLYTHQLIHSYMNLICISLFVTLFGHHGFPISDTKLCFFLNILKDEHNVSIIIEYDDVAFSYSIHDGNAFRPFAFTYIIIWVFYFSQNPRNNLYRIHPML